MCECFCLINNQQYIITQLGMSDNLINEKKKLQRNSLRLSFRFCVVSSFLNTDVSDLCGAYSYGDLSVLLQKSQLLMDSLCFLLKQN